MTHLAARRRRFIAVSRVGLVFVIGATWSACGGGTTPGSNPQSETGTPTGRGVGDACDKANACRAGLACSPATSTCAPGGTIANGAGCTIGGECSSGMCGAKGTCEAPGDGDAGASCSGDADCKKGLRCAFDGASLFPKCAVEGKNDIGKTCASNVDCLQGLYCEAGKCDRFLLPPGAPAPARGIPPVVPERTKLPWSGATCPDPVKTGSITALFKVPRAGDDTKGDFFRLPFPNDAARVKSTGKVSYAQFPHDPSPAVGFDAIKLYLDALEGESFSPSPTVLFRFDGEYAFDSITLGGEEPQLRIVDVTPGAASFGQRHGLSMFVTNGRNKYICPNYLGVRTPLGDPLRPGATYAVVLKTGVKTKSDGSLAKPDSDFVALLKGEPPTDAALKDAYDAYAPLREYLSKQKITTDSVLNATVFTVGDPRAPALRLRTSARAAAAPVAEQWVKCEPGTKSPCAQADGDRACPAAPNPAFDELHAVLDMPIYQAGTAPYATTKDGGAIASAGDATSPIAPVRTEKVCLALTIPKGTAPASGWPIAIYAHGTGGSFRSHAGDGAAAALSNIDLGGGAITRFAVIGIDQVSHGPRRGASTVSPDNLFFNFANPAAARFNAIQGAADQHYLVRFAEGLSLDAKPTGSAVKFDPKAIVFWGHSQGATEGAIFLPFDATVKGALLSGEGASLVDALTSKTKPVNIKDGLFFALSEASPAAVGVWHPVLAIFQNWADPADPLHYANGVAIASDGGKPFARHVFQPYGITDSFSPSPTQDAFANAARLAFVAPELDGAKRSTVPFAQGNVTSGTTKVTVAARQYTPAGYDGHYVVFRNPQATGDAMKFLARAAAGEVPKLPE